MIRSLLSPWRQVTRRALAAALPRRVFLVRHRPKDRAVYLTFDDGPHPELTPWLLDLLKAAGTPATFFVVGREAEKHPDLIRRMIAEGHAVGTHSFSHTHRHLLTSREVLAELRRTRELLGP